MAAPEYVPSRLAEQPRTGLKLPPAEAWRADRPGDLGVGQPTGPAFGNPGPDQGYALVLARRFEDKLVLEENEHKEDAVAGCLGLALRRASIFGRAPVIYDLEIAFRIWGFLDVAPPELVALRKPLFQAAHHNYWEQRDIVDRVPISTLRLTQQEVSNRFPSDWKGLLGLS